MIYLKNFTLLDEFQEHDIACYEEVRRIFNQGNVVWQTAELGKVDQGGGGTIAYILANYGAEVIDCGIGVLNMHSPYEIVSKVDMYEMYKGYKAFFNINL